MPTVTTQDGIRLHVESTGAGPPVLFIHEFAGDHRSWEPQIRSFARRYRCITYAARGYPPSDVPAEPHGYSQDIAVGDALAVLDGMQISAAHVVGLSMGGFCALHLALRAPSRTRSIVAAGVGYGAPLQMRDRFRQECEMIARAFEVEGAEEVAPRYAVGPARVQFQNKDPRGHAEFVRMLAEHSSIGAAHTMRGVQMARPSLYDLTDELSALDVPTLILVGDEDEHCLEPDLMLKRTIPAAGLAVLPQSGHTLNLEEPALFNELVGRFLSSVEVGAWRKRDPRSRSASATGMTD